MKDLYLLGNWKMHHGPMAGAAWCGGFLDRVEEFGESVVGVFPPFVSLPEVGGELGAPEGRVGLGAQTSHWDVKGAYTGEISPEWLEELGCRWVLVGHSERRTLFGETDETVRRKLEAALAAGLEPVLCVGESLEEREAGDTETVLGRQLHSALGGLEGAFDEESGLLVAYEPVWAIGTGHTASPEQAEQAHRFIHGRLSELGGAAPVLYGGSVKPDNVSELVSREGVDGALVGGASLDPEVFADLIVRAVRAVS